MPNNDEIQRIAAAMNAVRPDWRTSSLVTFLTKHHATRAYQDLLIAGIVVALDPKTTTPQLLNQHGRWWTAAQQVFAATATPTVGPGRDRCTVYGHEAYRAINCAGCRADALITGVATANPLPPAPEPHGRDLAAGKD